MTTHALDRLLVPTLAAVGFAIAVAITGCGNGGGNTASAAAGRERLDGLDRSDDPRDAERAADDPVR